MNVKKKLISSLKKCFILSLCVVIGLAVSLSGYCASTLNYPLDLDYGVMSSWALSNDYMDGSNRWDKFESISSTKSFDCSYQLSSDGNSLFPDFVSGNSYSIYIKTAITINNTSLNTINPSSFSTNSYITVVMQNGSSSRVYPNVTYTRWSNGTGWTVNYTFNIPEGAKNIYSIMFGFSFSSYFTSSGIMYLTLLPFNLTSVTGTDKVIGAIGSDIPDNSQIDEYNKAESQLIGGVQSSLDGITSQWNNINGDLLQYQGAFFALRQFFNGLTDLPFISVVVTLSVAIGVFALLLGSALSFVNRNRK